LTDHRKIVADKEPKSPMKVAVVLNTSWNIYNFRLNFIKSLLAAGHEVHTIAPKDEYTHLLVELGCTHHNVKMDSRGANPIKDSALILELWSIYRKLKPAVILHYTIKPNVYGTLAAAMLGIPVINNVCGLGTVFLKDNLVSKIAISLYKISFRFAKKVFFQNPDDLTLFVSKGLIQEKAADILPGSGINLSHFAPAQYQRNKTFTFLMVSRLITDKGVLEYVNAIKRLRSQGYEAKFQVLGAMDPEHRRGIKKHVIQQWIDEGTFEYLGTTDDVRQYLHQADCIVLPSYREGTPRTLLEAACTAKPIIATDVPGCNHVVEDNYNGLLCKLKDEKDLAEKMALMSSLDDSTLKLFGKNGRAKMEAQFDENVVINKYLAALNEIRLAS
jgi:glycosyltransferase involved in cell wall biosynthesis